jgi:hypothetical protein
LFRRRSASKKKKPQAKPLPAAGKLRGRDLQFHAKRVAWLAFEQLGQPICQIFILSLAELFRTLPNNQVNARRKYARLDACAFRGRPDLAAESGEWRFIGVQVQQKAAKRRVLARDIDALDCAWLFPKIEPFGASDAADLPAILCNAHSHVTIIRMIPTQ